MYAPELTAALARSKPVAPGIILFAIGTHLVLKTVFFGSLFSTWFANVELATHGLISLSTVAIWIEILLIGGGVIFCFGKLRPADLGISLRSFATSIPIALTLWAVIFFLIVCSEVLLEGKVEFAIVQSYAIPSLVENFGSAPLFEEIFYRGFLFTQIFLLLRSRRQFTDLKALVVAVTTSQMFFALNHIPVLVRAAVGPVDTLLFVLQIALMGAMFCALYLQTQNLFLCIWMHALINEPLMLIASSNPPGLVVLCVILFAIVGASSFAKLDGSLVPNLQPSAAWR